MIKIGYVPEEKSKVKEQNFSKTAVAQLALIQESFGLQRAPNDSQSAAQSWLLLLSACESRGVFHQQTNDIPREFLHCVDQKGQDP
ncbi:hypothetical protein [Cohaesibacter sp. ES.047]|uniref:hypothetical protein n=1 Tax=Cohaesibacter sp. ES.047 TaxID=1798205 RepID=UPI0012FDF60E|nr:hypothetical protein [Cohaesibacter sp. ES.047]